MNNLFSHFYLLNKDISLDIEEKIMKFKIYVENIQGTVSQNFE